MKRLPFFVILFLFLILPPAFSQAIAASPTPERTQVTTPPVIAYTLPPDKLEKSRALYMQRVVLSVVEFAYSLAVLLAILIFGIASRYRNWAETISKRLFVQAIVVAPLLLLTMDLLQLPLDAYQHSLSLRYGLSVEGWARWLGDVLKSEILSVAIGIVFLWLLVIIIRWSPERWWLYFWMAAMPIALFIVFLKPVFIDPVFDKFYPLQTNHPQLAEDIERVVQRAGLSIPRNRIFEMKASEKVTVPNAYVTGFGSSKRVVVWDTTIAELTVPETLFVFGHEMGHYVLHHVVYGLSAGAIGLLLALYIMHSLARWLLQRFGRKWHIRDLGDWAALPAIFLIYGVLGFLASPVVNTVSRYIEHQADIYGLEVTHGMNPDSRATAVHSFQVIGETSLEYPDPAKLVVVWFYNHPPISDRMRFAYDYDPWGKSGPKYVK